MGGRERGKREMVRGGGGKGRDGEHCGRRRRRRGELAAAE